jgi:hypothetical protein
MSATIAELTSELDVFTEQEMAAIRGVKVKALADERSRGQGPPFTKLGKRILYPKQGVRKFLVQQTVNPSKARTLVDGVPRKRGQAKTAATSTSGEAV